MILVFSLRNVGGCERVLVGECTVSVGAGWLGSSKTWETEAKHMKPAHKKVSPTIHKLHRHLQSTFLAYFGCCPVLRQYWPESKLRKKRVREQMWVIRLDIYISRKSAQKVYSPLVWCVIWCNGGKIPNSQHHPWPAPWEKSHTGYQMPPAQHCKRGMKLLESQIKLRFSFVTNWQVCYDKWKFYESDIQKTGLIMLLSSQFFCHDNFGAESGGICQIPMYKFLSNEGTRNPEFPGRPNLWPGRPQSQAPKTPPWAPPT